MHVYEKAFTARLYGIGQAEAVFLFLVVAIVSGLQVYIGKKKEVEA
jgi:raffinose/stachyose/melibiose transport system permease protein